ncbi:cupin domain-containing protein [Oricola cellulosilytica]|uniref:Cupin domain-containing protein n=1 Tax=Oricola cellulosilytica TaxID=1429082 RepID=A0A4R0PFT4_9HYPH|nr:cupin domain-containing protein [Oricola cellulosilytica]TCD14354.1 cupin domain-containing protein [Oricola cellulosilytica]
MTIRDNRLPVDDIDIRRLAAPRGDAIPNNDLYPAIILPSVLGGKNEPATIHALYARNGWGGAWTWQVFDYHHFHPDAFEALAVASGGATLMLGGPQGEEIEVASGDVLILPPGYGHKQIRKSDEFRICGA